jgi:beta-galactosidase
LPPGPIAELLRMRVLQVSSLRPGLTEKVKGKASGTAERWRETLDPQGALVLAKFENGDAALVASGQHHYLACWPDQKLLMATMKLLVAEAKLKARTLPEGIRLRRRGSLLFVINYGNAAWQVPFAGKLVLGKRKVAPQDITILEAAIP